MKLSTLALACLLIVAAALPVMGANVYDNGPVNGNVDAWTINFGFAVSDSFVVSNGNGAIGGLNFWAWLIPGDVLSSVEVSIGDQPFGNNYYDELVTLTQSSCTVNNYDFDVCLESGRFEGPNLQNGNYWVSLQNARLNNLDPVYWDENSGVGCQSPGCPSTGTEGFEPIPSEAFTLTAQGTTSTGTTPEPGSLVLFASALFAAGTVMRRRFR